MNRENDRDYFKTSSKHGAESTNVSPEGVKKIFFPSFLFTQYVYIIFLWRNSFAPNTPHVYMQISKRVPHAVESTDKWPININTAAYTVTAFVCFFFVSAKLNSNFGLNFTLQLLLFWHHNIIESNAALRVLRALKLPLPILI